MTRKSLGSSIIECTPTHTVTTVTSSHETNKVTLLLFLAELTQTLRSQGAAVRFFQGHASPVGPVAAGPAGPVRGSISSQWEGLAGGPEAGLTDKQSLLGLDGDRVRVGSAH